MTTRDRMLALGLGGFIALAVAGGGGYLGLVAPYLAAGRRADALQNEIADAEAKLRQAVKDRPRVEAALRRSLPADPDLARQEYDALVTRLVREAKVPVTAYAVKPAQSRAGPAADLPAAGSLPKRPAFTRVALEVALKPVDYATLVDVLRRYYQLDLLHQITRLTVKKMDAGAAARRRESGGTDQADLDVTFVTEAIILDGAEARRTLLPVPAGIPAVAGGAALTQPEPARGLAPAQLAKALAAPARDYAALLVHDVFHGPPPPPAPPPPEPPPVVKEDTSPYIRLTGLGRNPDGTGTAVIEDAASKTEYVVDLSRADGGRLEAKVGKHYYSAKGVRKTYDPDDGDGPDVLDISDASSGTARKFRVVGLDGDALVLLAKAGPAPKAAGGPGDDRVYLWRHGQPLNKVEALPKDEGRRAVRRAAGETAVSTSADGPGR